MRDDAAQYQSSFTLPTGATSGARMVFDGENGSWLVYDADDQLRMEVRTDDLIQTVLRVMGGLHNPPGDRVEYGYDEVRFYQWDDAVNDGATVYYNGFKELLLRNLNGLTAALYIGGPPTSTVEFQRSLRVDGVLYAGTSSGGRMTWTNLALENGWTSYLFAPWSQVAQYKLNADGRVYVRGLIQPGITASPTTIFTVPAGYRPTAQRRLVSPVFGGAMAEFNLLTSGAFQVTSWPGGGTGFSLDQISWDVL